jgi:hypothetical protein
MQADAAQQSQDVESGGSPPQRDASAAASAAGSSAPVSGTSSLPAAAGQAQMSSADLVRAATKALNAAGSGSRGATAGSSASSGLMIDGFLVPPHVLQALQVCTPALRGGHSSTQDVCMQMHACAQTSV